jgi:diguanylate cyclase (GGDEF)-like protein
LSNGLKACSSWPIFGKSRKVLGTVALYFREAMAPTKEDLQLFSICTNLAGIAVESRASEEKIRYLAHYDGLTSLPNRFLFKEFLDLALRNARRHRKKFAVFFLDLDKFKDINDTFGHEAGDHVLKETAQRLRGCLRQTDKIARMGGDEFYILIEDLNDGQYAADVARKLLEEASRPLYIGDQQRQLSVSIGIGIYPDDGKNGQTLLKNADSAMYRAKHLGKNGYQFYSAPN